MTWWGGGGGGAYRQVGHSGTLLTQRTAVWGAILANGVQ
jgi:hypothetical protein